MNRLIGNIVLLILSSMIISCNGQVKTNRESTEIKRTENNSKIPIPKYGFNSGLLDSEGDLWFGSNGDGIYRYNGTSFTNYTIEDGLNSNKIFSMIEDQNRNLWFGTADGLLRYNGESFKHVPIPYSDTTGIYLEKVRHVINPNAVHSLLEDKKGNIWIGTGGAGAYRYDGEVFTSFQTEIGHKQEDNRYHNWITSIAEDNEGNIWFSSMTRGGASRFDGETFTQFMPKDGLFTDMVRTIFTDKSGNVWFGYKATDEGGLTKYDGKLFTNFNTKDGLCNSSIMVMYEANNGSLWLGGDMNNLCIYDGKNFKEFKSIDGKPFEQIITIIEDKKGAIWFGGRNGLWKFDGESVIKITK